MEQRTAPLKGTPSRLFVCFKLVSARLRVREVRRFPLGNGKAGFTAAIEGMSWSHWLPSDNKMLGFRHACLKLSLTVVFCY